MRYWSTAGKHTFTSSHTNTGADNISDKSGTLPVKAGSGADSENMTKNMASAVFAL